MTGAIVPDQDHIGVHCNSVEARIDPATGHGVVSPDALRIDADGLSATWFEFFPDDNGNRFVEVCLATARGGRRPKRSHFLASFLVGNVRSVIRRAGLETSVVHEPIGSEGESSYNPAHCLMKGMPADDDENAALRQLICEEVDQVRAWPVEAL